MYNFEFDLKKLPNAKLNKKNKKKNIFIVGVSVATLVASGGTTPVQQSADETLTTSGDVSGDVTAGDDTVMIGMNDGTSGVVEAGGGDDVVVGGKGDDTIGGGSGEDVIVGGEGVDDINGGGGVDQFVVIGTTDDDDYSEDDLQNIKDGELDLTDVVDVDMINDHETSDVVAGESIDGGEDGAELYALGVVDFTGVELANITTIYLDNMVTIEPETLRQLIDGGGLVSLQGEGVIKASEGVLDLDGVDVPPEVEIQDADGNVILPEVDVANSIGTSVSILENSTEVGQISVTDESAVGDVTYTLSGADADMFEISATDGTLSFIAAPDFENAQDVGADNVYDVIVTITDEHQKSVSQNIAIGVTDADEGPIFAADQQSVFTVQEGNSYVGEVSATDFENSVVNYTLHNANGDMLDDDLFVIDEDGHISFKVKPDYENPTDLDNDNGYSFYVSAFDAQGHETQFETQFQVQVTDVEHEPVVTVSHEVAKLGAEFVVNKDTFNSQSSAASAALANGNLNVSVWQTLDVDADGSSFAIKSILYDNSTDLNLYYEKSVNSTTTGGQTAPDVAALTGGGYVVSWTSEDHPDFGQLSDIRARVFTDSGSAVDLDDNGFVDADFLVHGQTIGTQKDSQVIGLSNGGFVIGWTNGEPLTGDQSGSSVRFQTYLSDGTKFSSELGFNSQGLGDQDELALATLTGGGFVASWTSDHISEDGSGSAIKYRIYDDSIGQVLTETLANSETEGSQTNSTVTGLAGGGFVLAWETYDESQDGSGRAIKAQVFNAAGDKVGDEFLVNDQANSNQIDPDVEALSDGGFAISWTSADEVHDGHLTGIVAKTYDAYGRELGHDFGVNSQQDWTQNGSHILANDDGGFRVLWNNLDAAGDGSGSSIAAQIFERVPLLKFEEDGSHDISLYGALGAGQMADNLSNISISDSPEGVSFSHSAFNDDNWFVLPNEIGQVQIILAPEVNGSFELTVSQSSYGTGGSAISTFKVPVSVGHVIDEGVGTQIVSATDKTDHIDLGIGNDLVKFTGEKADYSFALMGNDLQVTHTASGDANIDLLHGVEKIQFGGDAVINVTALDDLGDITSLTGDDYDVWLAQNYAYDF